MSSQTLASAAAPADSNERVLPETCVAGRYRIDSVLGSGGMGVVYAATHLELGLPLALKILHPALTGSAEARARFCLEARAGAALRSPHALRVYDAGLLGSEECFIVMERLEGKDLQALVHEQGPLPVDVAVNYVMQACAGLAEAHALGLVHRDIKPENLFLAQQGGDAPVIKIMDFGVARWRRTDSHGRRLTNPRSNVGSPCYQSPEQMQNAASVDERSDIWSLGLVLFELLTGYCPFESDNVPETCWKVLQGPRPSLLAALPRVDPALEQVFQRCVSLDREARFRSVMHLSAALRPFARLAGGAASQPPASAPAPATARVSPARRRHWPTPLLLAATFLLGAGLASAFQTLEVDLATSVRQLRAAPGELRARAEGLLAGAEGLLASTFAAAALHPAVIEEPLSDAR